MEALVAVSSILFLFWPLILIFGFWEIFSRENTLAEKVKVGSFRVFIGWVIWAGIIGILYWQGRQPIIFIFPGYNVKIFLIIGGIFGILSMSWWIEKWLKHRVRLSTIREVEALQELSPRAFEKLVAKIFQAYGYETRLSEKSSDHGIDIVVTSDKDEVWIVQCKRYRGSVGEPIIRDLYGAMQHEKASKAFLATSGSFTQKALKWAEDKPIILYDGERLVELIRNIRKKSD